MIEQNNNSKEIPSFITDHLNLYNQSLDRLMLLNQKTHEIFSDASLSTYEGILDNPFGKK